MDKYLYSADRLPLTMMRDVAPEEELRDASIEAAGLFDDFASELGMNDSFYLAVKDYKEQAIKRDEWDKLDPIDRRFIK